MTTQALAPHQQRVVDEKADLDKRATALSQFIGCNPLFQTLPEDEQKRMETQNSLQWQLSKVLGERIAAFLG